MKIKDFKFTTWNKNYINELFGMNEDELKQIIKGITDLPDFIRAKESINNYLN